MDEESEQKLSQLRKRYFPESRNFLKAHITLFHSAPEEICDLWKFGTKNLEVRFLNPFFLGKGFAVEASCPEISNHRKKLLSMDYPFTPQDLSLKKLHVTIQNKEEPGKARKDFEIFKAEWQNFSGEIRGVSIWTYLNGPWKHDRDVLFNSPEI